MKGLPEDHCGLYNPRHEHDACGVGLLVNVNGIKSHRLVEQGLQKKTLYFSPEHTLRKMANPWQYEAFCNWLSYGNHAS